MSVNGKELPADAVGLRLGRFIKDDLRQCEAVRFVEGRPAVDTILRRAALSGRVEIGGEIKDHIADVLNENADVVETIALDAKSFSSLKNYWMRCKYESEFA